MQVNGSHWPSHANKIIQTGELADDATNSTIPHNLAVLIDVKFPNSEVFGVKLVNGRATRASLDFTNKEPEPVEVTIIGGALVTLDPLAPGAHPNTGIVRNLTSTRYSVTIPAGGKQNVPYSFTMDMNPQELRLQIMAVVQSQEGDIYQIQAFNETVSIVEPPTSIFDPQMWALIPSSPFYANYYHSIFLYFFLLAAFAGTMYFVYKTWIETLFPQARRGGKGGERAKRSSASSKKAASPLDKVSAVGADSPAVTTGAATQNVYDESWIPEHHINRPGTKRAKSGASGKAKP
jgi:hypothetical protein